MGFGIWYFVCLPAVMAGISDLEFKKDMLYDVIIIGGACAGLSAAIYSGRRALKTLVITKVVGGQAAITTEIENYPGFLSIPGPDLMNKFKEQAESFGAEIKLGEVTNIEKLDNHNYLIKTAEEEFEAKTVILTFGLEHRKLGISGEKEFFGRGVTYCATCDGPFFKGKTVGVVGGGNSAFDAADYLADICEKVYLFVRKNEYRAEKVLIDSVKNKKNIEIMNFTEVTECLGEKKLQKVKLINNQTNKESEIELDGLFIEIGWRPKTEIVKNLVELNDKGYIITDNEQKTSVPGIFAAGDVTETPFKQAIVSAGEGAKAGLSAARYVKGVKGEFEGPSDLSKRH